MKKLTILLLIAGLQACSSVSKETYTETRTLTYPKGGKPHLKEMYLQDGNQEQHTYIGAAPTPKPEPYVSDHDLIAPVPEVNNYQTSYEPEKTLDQLITENLMLQAKQRNAWLRNQM